MEIVGKCCEVLIGVELYGDGGAVVRLVIGGH